MWFFTRQSFISIVEHLDDPNKLLVRARLPEDIRALWADADVLEDRHADYRYRAVLPRSRVAQALHDEVMKIRYTTNFKGGVKDQRRHDAYLRVWSAMRDLQVGDG